MNLVKKANFALLVTVVFLVRASVVVTLAADLQLVEAAKNRDAHLVAELLKQKVNVDEAQPDGSTALHWAAHWNELETISMLIKAGAQVNLANRYGATPLWLASGNGSESAVLALLKVGADPNVYLVSGETPLMVASRSGDVDVITALLNYGSIVDEVEKSYGQTALMWAIAEGHIDVVKTLIAHEANLNKGSRQGFTPLMFSARVGNEELGRLLVSHGADVNAVADDGSSPLLVASVRGHVPLAKFLLDQGADPNIAQAGYTALHWASGIWESNTTYEYTFTTGEWAAWAGIPTRDKKFELIEALIVHGADVNARMTKSAPRYGFTLFGLQWSGASLAGATPFYLAAMSGDVETMRVLLNYGADPLISAADQTTPLMVAAGRARTDAETRILEADALAATILSLKLGNDINAVNEAGETALHAAALAGLDTVTEHLVKNGADLNMRTNQGLTALAITEGVVVAMQTIVRPSTAALLRKLGARSIETSGVIHLNLDAPLGSGR